MLVFLGKCFYKLFGQYVALFELRIQASDAFGHRLWTRLAVAVRHPSAQLMARESSGQNSRYLSYDRAVLNAHVAELLQDESIGKRANIYEYLLGGEQHPELLEVRIFEESTKKTVYNRQTEQARANGTLNCPLCAIGTGNNRTRIYKLSEMDADHVTAWSKGGATSIDNCQMLCKTHNRAKGNK